LGKNVAGVKMAKNISDNTSSIESSAWETSGITSGAQVLNRTSGLPFWTEMVGTGHERVIEYDIIPDVTEDDNSNLLIRDKRFRKSIERAREQMRKGGPYLLHNDVFGE
jgi:hypothetical protein